eukprot:CAMPEP_0177614854 /NCGR_PEP_ID=MMETSP0419_2-20121207/23023_1 /TAXON_ID=582737 /ORGANISM="Tetraselmis sp., Strain GSL018" /LENGTH=56 /DNA_ID=CAMNT_0019112231 /DNA_START=625 /DNA_END=791 /DNA_ORIENTATION=+
MIENASWSFGPQAIANTLWALGKLECYPSGILLEVLAERALWCLNDFKPEELSIMS